MSVEYVTLDFDAKTVTYTGWKPTPHTVPCTCGYGRYYPQRCLCWWRELTKQKQWPKPTYGGP